MNYLKRNIQNFNIRSIKSIIGILCISSCIYSIILYIYQKNIEEKITTTIINTQPTESASYCGYKFISTNNGKIVESLSTQPTNALTVQELFLPRYHSLIEKKLTEATHKAVLVKNIYDELHPHWLLLKKYDNQIYGCIIFPHEAIKPFTAVIRHLAIQQSLTLLLALCCFLILLSIFFIRNHYHWWYIVTAISACLLVEIGYLWHLRSSIGFIEEHQLSPLLTTENLNIPNTHSIPTGIYIEYAQFASPSNDIYPGILVNGYIWQRYNTHLHKGIERGFIIPNAFTITTKEIAHETQGSEERICWAFSALLYQGYTATLYPFDHRHVTIPVAHSSFEKNIMLIPDFNAYSSLMPNRLPGVAKQTILPYWTITSSFFALVSPQFNATLGSSTFNTHLPYLTFVVTAQRILTGEFIMYFILLGTILLIAFVLLLAFLIHTKITSLLGFSTLGVAGSCSGLLFVLITSQVGLRQQLIVQGIVYIEYLYFVCYLVLLGVIINSVIFALKQDLWVVAYKNNLIPKLLYWPITLSLIVGITAYMFY